MLIQLKIYADLSPDDARFVEDRLKMYAEDLIHDLDPNSDNYPLITSRISTTKDPS